MFSTNIRFSVSHWNPCQTKTPILSRFGCVVLLQWQVPKIHEQAKQKINPLKTKQNINPSRLCSEVSFCKSSSELYTL